MDTKQFHGARFTTLVQTVAPDLSFTVLEIGARPAGEETCHALLDWFPQSRIFAFEPDVVLCDELNSSAAHGLEYVPKALGRRSETRTFYVCKDSLCSSLYPPNDAFNDRFNHMQGVKSDRIVEIDTISLDEFATAREIESVDLVKIDVQGAELEVFQGGEKVVESALAIVTEVEFSHHYEGQPLFGDVHAYLMERGFAFQKFLYIGGSTLNVLDRKLPPNVAGRQIWADALFLKDVSCADRLDDDMLLKFSVLGAMYRALDVSLWCCREYDGRQGTRLERRAMKIPGTE